MSCVLTRGHVFEIAVSIVSLVSIFMVDGAAISRRRAEKGTSHDTMQQNLALSTVLRQHDHDVAVFPTDNATWVYDALTAQWHRRGFWDPNVMAFTAYRPCHAFAFGGIGFGKHLVGDRSTGIIATLNTLTGTDIDSTSVIRRVRTCPHLSPNLQRLTIWALIIDLEVGLGTATGQATDPTVMLQVSKDGGKTWEPERWRSGGVQGTYFTRVKFNRLGASRDWVFRLVVTDPIPWRVARAFLELDDGTA